MFDIKTENSWGDQDGRIVLINAYFKAFKFSLCNIYAPNNAALQKLFIESLGEILISKAEVSNLIVGGDWNVTLEAIDKKGGIQWKPTPYRNLVVGLMNKLNFDDILRTKNPDKKCFTYESKALKIKSGIDFFLIAKPLTIKTKTADIRTVIAPDHMAIRLSLQTDSNKKGPGLWKFNNSLLEDEIYVSLIRDNYSNICSKYAYLNNPKLKCEMIKMEIRGLTIPYAKNKARNVRNLQGNSSAEGTAEAEQEEYERIRTELNRIYERRADGAILRSKIRWIEHGEKPTKYFSNMERNNYNKKTITELTFAEGGMISEDNDILEEIRRFYENLYTTEMDIDLRDSFTNFTADLSTNLPKLTENERVALEAKLT